MYAVLWRALPGPVALKVVWVVLLLAGVVAVCFEWLFPLVASWLPYDETTVGTDTGAAAHLLGSGASRSGASSVPADLPAQLTSALELPRDH